MGEPSSRFNWRHVANHRPGDRTIQVYRDDQRGATLIQNLTGSSWSEMNPQRRGKAYYYLDDDFAPGGPYYTEDALYAAMLQPDTLMLEEVLDGETEAPL